MYFIFSVAESALGQVSLLTPEHGNIICPDREYVLTCIVSATVNSITWKYGCYRNQMMPTNSVSRDLSYGRMANVNCSRNSEYISFMLSFNFTVIMGHAISNVSVYGQTSNKIRDSVSLFVKCDTLDTIEEVVISGKPSEGTKFNTL